MNCELCGTEVKVMGGTTKYYEAAKGRNEWDKILQNRMDRIEELEADVSNYQLRIAQLEKENKQLRVDLKFEEENLEPFKKDALKAIEAVRELTEQLPYALVAQEDLYNKIDKTAASPMEEDYSREICIDCGNRLVTCKCNSQTKCTHRLSHVEYNLEDTQCSVCKIKELEEDIELLQFQVQEKDKRLGKASKVHSIQEELTFYQANFKRDSEEIERLRKAIEYEISYSAQSNHLHEEAARRLLIALGLEPKEQSDE